MAIPYEGGMGGWGFERDYADISSYGSLAPLKRIEVGPPRITFAGKEIPGRWTVTRDAQSMEYGFKCEFCGWVTKITDENMFRYGNHVVENLEYHLLEHKPEVGKDGMNVANYYASWQTNTAQTYNSNSSNAMYTKMYKKAADSFKKVGNTLAGIEEGPLEWLKKEVDSVREKLV